MKDQVLDLSEVLKAVNGKIDSLTNQVIRLTAQLDTALSENAVLKEKIVVLEARLAVYEAPPKDSHNSSIPPSKESLRSQSLRSTRSLREKSGKPTGGQKGHKGTTLEMTSTPDLIEEHTASFCTHCGKDLSDITGIVAEVRQSIDVPPVVRSLITEHRVMSKACTCGHCNKVEFPKEVRATTSYGPNVKALIAYLNTYQFIPFLRLKNLLSDCFGINMSEGTISNILQEMKQNTRSAYDTIRCLVEKSKVVGADETGEHINGELHWTWVWQTENLTYIHQDKSRGCVAINKHFPNGLPQSVLVTDRHSSYFNMNVKHHQICLAHILRELIYLSELDPTQKWSSQMTDLLRDAIHKRKTECWEKIDRSGILTRFENLLSTVTNHLHQKIQNLQKSLVKHKDHVFAFLKDPDIPYENNASERAVRPLKVKQKVSGNFRSQEGANAFCQLHSITNTAKKNDQNPLSALIAVAYNN